MNSFSSRNNYEKSVQQLSWKAVQLVASLLLYKKRYFPKRMTGRPPKESGYVARKRVTYRLQPGLVQAIRRGARRRKISQTAYIELALQEWIKSDGIQMPPAR